MLNTERVSPLPRNRRECRSIVKQLRSVEPCNRQQSLNRIDVLELFWIRDQRAHKCRLLARITSKRALQDLVGRVKDVRHRLGQGPRWQGLDQRSRKGGGVDQSLARFSSESLIVNC